MQWRMSWCKQEFFHSVFNHAGLLDTVTRLIEGEWFPRRFASTRTSSERTVRREPQNNLWLIVIVLEYGRLDAAAKEPTEPPLSWA